MKNIKIYIYIYIYIYRTHFKHYLSLTNLRIDSAYRKIVLKFCRTFNRRYQKYIKKQMQSSKTNFLKYYNMFLFVNMRYAGK
jgi:hypothetical protein